MILEFEGQGYALITRSTIERDIALSNHLRSSGVQEAIIAALAEGHEPDSKIFEAVTSSGKIFDIIACSVVPEGTDALDWTPALARQTAEHLKHITDPEAKRLLVNSVVAMVTSFFMAGLHSSLTSLKSSPVRGKVAQPGSASAATSIVATGG